MHASVESRMADVEALSCIWYPDYTAGLSYGCSHTTDVLNLVSAAKQQHNTAQHSTGTAWGASWWLYEEHWIETNNNGNSVCRSPAGPHIKK